MVDQLVQDVSVVVILELNPSCFRIQIRLDITDSTNSTYTVSYLLISIFVNIQGSYDYLIEMTGIQLKVFNDLDSKNLSSE